MISELLTAHCLWSRFWLNWLGNSIQTCFKVKSAFFRFMSLQFRKKKATHIHIRTNQAILHYAYLLPIRRVFLGTTYFLNLSIYYCYFNLFCQFDEVLLKWRLVHYLNLSSQLNDYESQNNSSNQVRFRL